MSQVSTHPFGTQVSQQFAKDHNFIGSTGAKPSDLVWNNELLIDSGSWEEVGMAAIGVHQKVIKHLINKRALPTALGLRYWQQLPDRGFVTGVGLFWVQTGPAKLFNFSRNALLTPEKVSIVSITRSINFHWPNLKPLAKVHSMATKDWLYATTGWILWQWRKLLSFVYSPVLTEASVHCQKLQSQNLKVASSIGQLLTGSWQGDSVESKITNTVALLDKCVHQSTSTAEYIPLQIDSPEEALKTLQHVLDVISHDHYIVDMPSTTTKWWPMYAVGIVAAYYLTGSWRNVISWLQNSVAETFRSFWLNWVYEPVKQIILTIRHDPHAEITLMAKQSLESDVSSLERMVNEFVQSTADRPLDSSAISLVAENTRNGDLTPVLQAYEKQILTPIRSLLTGQLLRTLLIQVQKGKVDVEVALSGIDRLLQSQQLVFGLVAALPALAVIIWIGRSALSNVLGYSSRRQLYQSGEAREEFLERLAAIYQLASSSGPNLSDETVGLVFIESELTKRACMQLSKPGKTRKRQLCSMIDCFGTISAKQELLIQVNRVLSLSTYI